MTIRYISDLHFGHKNIIAYDNRPFSSVEEMDEAMISLWNETVKKGDQTYVLGDFCWSQTYEVWESILKRLNGQVFVIKGNHDRSEILKRLTKENLITGWSQQEIIGDEGRKVVLNHSPMPFFINEHHNGWAHLYGHVHISYDWNMTLNMQRQISEFYQRFSTYSQKAYMSFILRTRPSSSVTVPDQSPCT